ncbi:MAG: toll/interleukin-1 receptor domain-containing protein [Chitinophagaceae bacterium]|nr:MAG: toll/interleukin-1 receptor domain-containing protein [Chitinophagaceae bacterium]
MATYKQEVNRKPDVFLSHSSIDNDFVRKLAKDLTSCEIDVWLDEREIAPGDSIYRSISQGIQSSRYIALIISKNFLASKWVSEEIESSFAKQIESNSTLIIPILIEPVELPPLLKGKLNIPFLEPEEYYWALMLLAGIIHGIDLGSVIDTRLRTQPESLQDVIRGLRYCGIEPYMIVPKHVFDELSKSEKVEVSGNRLRFYNLSALLADDSLTGISKSYIEELISLWK